MKCLFTKTQSHIEYGNILQYTPTQYTIHHIDSPPHCMKMNVKIVPIKRLRPTIQYNLITGLPKPFLSDCKITDYETDVRSIIYCTSAMDKTFLVTTGGFHNAYKAIT